MPSEPGGGGEGDGNHGRSNICCSNINNEGVNIFVVVLNDGRVYVINIVIIISISVIVILVSGNPTSEVRLV